jgi:formylmethanofuran dehydrogenase subunit E
MLKQLSEYERLAERAHGHLCAGQILGVRMAMLGLTLLGMDDPEGRDRKRLITVIEIDRCVADAISVVTGCRLGKRALKFRDFGKTAATFCDLEAKRAVRVAAKDSSRELADSLFSSLPSKAERQMAAYRELPDSDLFEYRWVQVDFDASDLPGFKAPRAVCAECGESVNFRREVIREGHVLCRSCAGDSYYRPL